VTELEKLAIDYSAGQRSLRRGRQKETITGIAVVIGARYLQRKTPTNLWGEVQRSQGRG
jgi:hypothetical protein